METGIAPSAGPSVGPPHALWFLALWHLLMVWTWAWGGVENEAGAEGGAGGWAASVVACGVVPEAKAEPVAVGDWVGTLTGTEGGFVSAQVGTADGEWGESWSCEKGEESPRDCAG